MNISRYAMPAVIALCACCLLSSCNKEEEKGGGKEKPAAGEARPAGAGGVKREPLTNSGAADAEDGGNKAGVPPVIAPKNIGEVLTSIPCKLDDQFGAYAVFPTNPAAGQTCFSLAADSGKEIPPFDIKANEMSFVIHERAAIDPKGVKLMKWRARDGKPCLRGECGSEVLAERKVFNDPKNPGAVFLFVIPVKTVPLGLPSPDFYGITIRTGGADAAQLPVFN